MALNEIAQAAALTHLIGVFDRGAHAALSLRGCAGESLRPPMTFDGVEMLPVLYEVGAAMDEQFRRLAGEAAGRRIDPAELERTRLRG